MFGMSNPVSFNWQRAAGAAELFRRQRGQSPKLLEE